MTAKVFYEVACEEHGKNQAKGLKMKYIIVPKPKSRRGQGMSGCPVCRKEKQGLD